MTTLKHDSAHSAPGRDAGRHSVLRIGPRRRSSWSVGGDPVHTDRPKTGLTIREAFARWADRADVEKLHEYRDAAYCGVMAFGGPETEFDIRQGIYIKHEAGCCAALKSMLKEGMLLASGIS